MKGANLLVSHLHSLQKESMFDRFYVWAIEESKSFTEEPKLPRKQKLPHRLDHGPSAAHQHSSPKEMYRQIIYYETIDIVSEVKRRFDQSDIFLIRDLENLLLSYANNQNPADLLSQTLVDFIEKDVNVECLKVQLAMLPDLIKTAFNGTIKKVTNIRTIADAMMQSDIYKTILCEVNKLLLLYFTFPVTTATAKRLSQVY